MTPTPGPWTMDYPHIRYGAEREDGSWPAVAKVLTLVPRSQREANARLIAAAPTLAAALTAIANEFGDTGRDLAWARLHARAALRDAHLDEEEPQP